MQKYYTTELSVSFFESDFMYLNLSTLKFLIRVLFFFGIFS